jgi:hypothetical protein
MNKKVFPYCFLLIFMICTSLCAQKPSQSIRITKVWEGNSGLDMSKINHLHTNWDCHKPSKIKAESKKNKIEIQLPR